MEDDGSESEIEHDNFSRTEHSTINAEKNSNGRRPGTMEVPSSRNTCVT